MCLSCSNLYFIYFYLLDWCHILLRSIVCQCSIVQSKQNTKKEIKVGKFVLLLMVTYVGIRCIVLLILFVGTWSGWVVTPVSSLLFYLGKNTHYPKIRCYRLQITNIKYCYSIWGERNTRTWKHFIECWFINCNVRQWSMYLLQEPSLAEFVKSNLNVTFTSHLKYIFFNQLHLFCSVSHVVWRYQLLNVVPSYWNWSKYMSRTRECVCVTDSTYHHLKFVGLYRIVCFQVSG